MRLVLCMLVLGSVLAVEPVAPPMPVAPPAPNAGIGSATEYHLYAGDGLKMDVFDNPELSVQLRVPTTGSVNLPLIGEVNHLIGRTLDDLTQEVRTRLEAKYLRSATVTLVVTDYSPRFAFTMGAVKTPSAIVLSPFVKTTAMQAVGQSGGFLEEANRTQCMLVRDAPSGVGKISIPMPAKDTPSDLANDIILQPGDLIIAPRMDRVYIVGEVKNGGAVNLPSLDPLTVSRSVALAGGFGTYARKDKVLVLRSGTKPVIVDVESVLKGQSTFDPQLQPGDTVFVPEGVW